MPVVAALFTLGIKSFCNFMDTQFIVCKIKTFTYLMFWCLNSLNSSLVIVCVLLGISPASDCDLPTFRNPLSVPSSNAGRWN
jgi:hypothetical protein